MIKKLTIFVLCFTLVFILCSCKNIYASQCKPASQPNTFWISEDGSISFYVHSYDRVLGKAKIGDEEIELQFWWEVVSTLKVYSLDFLKDNIEPYEHEDEFYLLEEWSCVFLGENMFIATVEETTHFKEGDKIIFKKTNVGDNEIVYLD